MIYGKQVLRSFKRALVYQRYGNRHFSSTDKYAPRYKVGDNIFGYTVKEVEKITELNLTAIRLEHKLSGADHLHIHRDDNNNLFSVSLRTTPENSKGVPHILEHLSLCGSKTFPCRDPFFNMLNRSLATFMNALTGSDCTMYPFSTQNTKDFSNLLSVYLDAVFNPLLNEKDFRQEGWRLEHNDVNDSNSSIIFKGVVFNEMKGVFSDPNQYYARHLQNELFPSSTYSYESGGDPLVIPNLSWQELKEFHSKHYHPSNSRFYTYGNLPLESHLEQIENQILKHYSKAKIDNAVPNEKPWKKPKEVRIYNRYDPMASFPDKQTTVSVSYLLNGITDTYETSALSILGTLLTDGPNAPFYQSLLESGIGPDFSPGSGYDSQLKQSVFSIGLREIAEKDIDRVKEIIESTFDNVIRTGFSSDRIKAILHNVELSTKHQTKNFGLRCAMSLNALWTHGGDPVNALKVNEHVKWFKDQLEKNPRFLEDKIVQYFKNNNHKLTLIMSPKETFEMEMKEKENELLQSKIKGLSPEDKSHIFNAGIDLLKHQQKSENVSCLPSLQISDVQKICDKTALKQLSLGGIGVQLCEQPTNEVVYFKAISLVDSLPEDLLMLLPLFSAVATKMGAGHRDYKQFDQEVELKTGGLEISVHFDENPSMLDTFEKGLYFSSYCLEKNVSDMFDLWNDIFNRIRLDDMDRLSQLIKMIAADLSQGIPSQGHVYSMRKSSSCLSSSADIREKLSGLTQISYMKNLAEMDNYEEVVKKLRKLAEIFLHKKRLRCAINAMPTAMDSTTLKLESFLSSLTRDCLECDKGLYKCLPRSEKTHFILPFSVNYLGRSIVTIPYTHEDFASLRVAAKLLTSKFLHREIREKGGAYGGGATLKKSGTFMFYSYRDPCLLQTLNSFDSGIKWLIDGDYPEQHISEAKLGIFGEIDQPIPPGSKGLAMFISNISDDMKQQLRERLFSCTKSDLIRVAKKYLENCQQNGIALIGPESDITKNDGWILHKE